MNGNKYNLVIPSGLDLDNAVVNNTASSYTSKVGRESIVGLLKLLLMENTFLGLILEEMVLQYLPMKSGELLVR